MNAAIYCRISRDREGSGLGVTRQEADCRALCATRGWDVAGIYVDNDTSASSGKPRPEYLRLLDDIKNGLIQAVVAYHNDRLIRSPRELEDFIDLIDGAGAEVATVMGGEYDLTTGTGKMAARIVGAVARAESDRLSERVRRKHLELARAGAVSGGGHRPFGYEVDRMTVIEPEARQLREAAARLLAGESLRGICAGWNRQGLKPAYGPQWMPMNLRRLLVAGRVAGKREHRGEIVGPAQWPAILDEPTWLRVRALLLDPARRNRVGPRSYLLTGIVRCGLCGANLVARPGRGGRAYVCSTGPGFHGCGKIRILADRLEDFVKDSMFHAIDRDDVAKMAPDDGELDEASGHVAELEERLAELSTDYYADRAISKEQFVAASQRLTDNLIAAQVRVASLARVRQPVPVDLRATWDDEPFSVKRAALEGRIRRVTVHPADPHVRRFQTGRIKIDHA